VKQDELAGDSEFTMTSDLGANHQVIEKEIEDNLENGKEYVKIT
jgi:hypothetical protein